MSSADDIPTPEVSGPHPPESPATAIAPVEGVPIACNLLTPTPKRHGLPGRHALERATWHPARELSAPAQAELYRVLPVISTIAFGLDTAPYWLERYAEDFFEKTTELTLIFDAADRLVGWATFRAFEAGRHRCLYLDSTGVLPAYQAEGLISRMQGYAIIRELLKAPLAPLYLTMRTESPVIYRMLQLGVGRANIYPQPVAAPPPAVRDAGRRTAQILRQDEKLNEPELRIEHAYVELYGRADDSVPTSGDPELDAFFREALGLDDAFIVVAKLTFPSAVRWMAHRLLPKRPQAHAR